MAKKDQMGDVPKDIAAMKFEVAMAELEEIVRDLEGGQGDLDSSIALYSRGALLKRHCEAKLNAASEQVEKIVTDDDGKAQSVESADF